MAALDEAELATFGVAAQHVHKARVNFDPRWDGLACVTELDERLAAAA